MPSEKRKKRKKTMRRPKFLSPSAASKWRSDRAGYYLKYLAEVKQPREPQQIYMGVGSGLDAYVKAEIAFRTYGKPVVAGSEYCFPTLFEKQVEHHHRDRVMKLSTEVWESYKASGAFEALWADVAASPSAPMMEREVSGPVGKAVLFGYPDLVYVDATTGKLVIADFKILGSGSKKGGGASPPQGFKIVRDGWASDKQSKNNGGSHKKYEPFDFFGLEIGKGYLEQFNIDWADQLTTYAWLLGQPVGSEEFLVRIECAACRHPAKIEGMRIKWSTHLNRVSDVNQTRLIREYNTIWAALESGHIFDDCSRQESDDRCEILEMQAAAPKAAHGPLQNLNLSQSKYIPRKVAS